MVSAEQVKYVRDCTGYSIEVAKAAAQLLEQSGLNIYSDEAAATMHMRRFYEKSCRYAEYQKIKDLIKEFGPLED